MINTVRAAVAVTLHLALLSYFSRTNHRGEEGLIKHNRGNYVSLSYRVQSSILYKGPQNCPSACNRF